MLHLIDQASPQASCATLALLADRGCSTLLLGGSVLRRRAEAAGLQNATCLPVPAGNAVWAVPTLRRWLANHAPGLELHAWSLSCLAALRWSGHGQPLKLHLVAPLDRTGLRRLRRLDNAHLRIHTAGQTLREGLIRHGFEPAKITAQPLPDLDTLRPRLSATRDAVRERWGIDDTTQVVALLSDPPTAADAVDGTLGLNLVAEATLHELRLLVHPEQSARPRMQAILDRYGHPDRMIQDARIATPWEVLPGVDAALLGSAPAVLSARYAAAAGVRVVAPDLPIHRETLADAEHAHFAVSAEPKRLADRLQHAALRLAGATPQFA